MGKQGTALFPQSRQSGPWNCGLYQGDHMSGAPGTVPVRACCPRGINGSFSTLTRGQAWTINPTVALTVRDCVHTLSVDAVRVTR